MNKFFAKILFFILFTSQQAFTVSGNIPQAPELSNKTDKYLYSLLSDRMFLGFLNIENYHSLIKINMQKVKDDGYNVIVISNAYVLGSDIDFYKNKNDIKKLHVLEKIHEAKDLGMKVLVSFGGVDNTFHPDIEKGGHDPEILGKSLTDSKINELANNIISFLRKNNIDGITFILRKYTSPELIDKLSNKIKQIDPNIIISIDAEINDYKLITHGKSHDYDKAIQNGNIDYIFLQEYNSFQQYDPNYISESYQKIIESTKIPLKTKILIDEPTNAIYAGANSIYHPKGNATRSLTTQQAVELMLPQLELLKFKPHFAGVAAQSLNTDYAANYFGYHEHTPGSFAQGLRDCIYKNTCISKNNKIDGPIVASFLPLWADNSSTFGRIVDLKMPNNKEYCDKYPEICKHNVIIAGYLIYKNNGEFELSFKDSDFDQKYTSEQLVTFINYMRLKGKRVLVSIKGNKSLVNWKKVNLDSIKKVIKDYGFDGINFDLSGSNALKNKDVSSLVAEKINNLISSVKQEKSDFWLTFSTEWDYIVAPLAKNSKDNIYTNHSYVEILNNIGANNIDYIFMSIYADKSDGSILSFYKDKNGQYLQISPLDGYDKFIASLAWALTTQEGYDANMPKYDVDNPFKLTADKLVFMIPSSKNALNNTVAYLPTKRDINNAVSLIKKHKGSLAGFAVLGAFDESQQYTSSILNTIVDIKLPNITSYVSDKIKKKTTTKNSFDLYGDIDTNIISYPNNIGLYDENTIIRYQGKKYKCISNLELELCNNKQYIPNGLLGNLAWYELSDIKKKKPKQKNNLNTPHKYPKNIGHYKPNQIIRYGDKKFICIQGKQKLCNHVKYNPTGKRGYLAWNDITEESNKAIAKNIQSDQFQKGVNHYIYPENIEYYQGGTVVSVDNVLYRCIMGPESILCSKRAYIPTGKYGKDAWVKIERQFVN